MNNDELDTLNRGKAIADAILQAQLIGKEVAKASQDGKNQFTELPRPLSYYYHPHQYKTVGAKQTEIVYNFNVPPNHVLHILQVGNTHYLDSFSKLKIDGTVFDRVERVISDINSPLNVKDRYIVAYHSVKWITTNNGDDDILSECFIDGLVWLQSDFNKWKQQLLNTVY